MELSGSDYGQYIMVGNHKVLISPIQLLLIT